MINFNAVFWDYPQYREEQYLRLSLSNNDNNFRLWVAGRFLEYGRAIDTLSLFSLKELIEVLPLVKLSEYARKKWNRLINVYGS
jgi:hypothetical protein